MSEQRIVCIGAVNIDRKIQPTTKLQLYTSNPATSVTSLGGVARNVAENLSKLGRRVAMISVTGNDAEGDFIRKQLSTMMEIEGITTLEGQSTGMYTAVLDETGEMYTALADMSIYEHLTPEVLNQHHSILESAQSIVVDLNSPKATLAYICEFAKRQSKELIFIAVSEPKMNRMPDELAAVRCLFVNLGETEAYFNTQAQSHEDIECLLKRWQQLGVQTVVLTNGSKEIVVADESIQWYSVKELESSKVVDVTGAGDSFSAAYIDSLLDQLNSGQNVLAGMTNAYHTIQTTETVRKELSKERLLNEMRVYKNE